MDFSRRPEYVKYFDNLFFHFYVLKLTFWGEAMEGKEGWKNIVLQMIESKS